MEKKVCNKMSHKPTRNYKNALDAKCYIWIDVLFYNTEMKLEKDSMFKVWQARCGSNIYLLKQVQRPTIFSKYIVCTLGELFY